MNISKSKVDLYQIRGTQNGWSTWADITIQETLVKDGDRTRNPFRISIASDYGNWQFFWSHPGACWRSFLRSIDIGYASNKFGASDWYDEEKSEKHLLENIIRRRREGNAEKNETRDAYDEVKSVFCDVGGSYDLVCHRLLQASEWTDFWGEYWYDQFYKRTDIEPCFKRFWTELWKPFLESLGEELGQSEAA